MLADMYVSLINRFLKNGKKYLSFRNNSGSVEHYYHFLLGFFVPLTLAIKRKDDWNKVFIRSCGIMDKHILDVKFPNVRIIDKESHKKTIKKYLHDKRLSIRSKVEEYSGFDEPSCYCYESFCSAKKILLDYISKDVNKESINLLENRPVNNTKVLLINREPSDPFYFSDNAEIKSSGASRRSIPNFNDIQKVITSKYPNTLSITLEGKSLAYQMAAFDLADIVVAQHGASLANIIWCKKGAKIVEVLPDDLRLENKKYFEELAKCMKLEYVKISQRSNHSEVDINELLGAF